MPITTPPPQLFTITNNSPSALHSSSSSLLSLYQSDEALNRRPTARPVLTRDSHVSSILAHGFPYSRKLHGHTSCVNALTFSRDGRFLVSGGDDLVLRLWDFHQEDLTTSRSTCVGPRGNVFTIAVSASNRFIYSGGTDETVLKYDISHSDITLNGSVSFSPWDRYTGHRDTIRGISCHPVLDEIVLSASEDGSIVRHDGRESPISATRKRAQDTLQLQSEVTGIEYHPYMDHLFLTSDNRGSVCLRDDRMAFGSLSRRSQLGIVQEYHTKLCRKPGSDMSNPESSSVTFDRDGEKFAVTFLHYYPTIYKLSDPNPIAILTANHTPGACPPRKSERTYSNSCTMKHGSFGGPGSDTDNLYAAGSDDFRGYVWKLPPIEELLAQRLIVSASEWDYVSRPNAIAFTQGDPCSTKCIPVEISQPLCKLYGHRSIVNTTAFHPSMLHIVTAGIERNIILHSPTPCAPCAQDLDLTETETRALSENGDVDRVTYYRAFYGLPIANGIAADDPDGTTISMFDHILREEGSADVFQVRRWSCPAMSGSSDEEVDDEDEDDEIGDGY
ncbi:hypothetical protein AMATHDRAFT_55347 [Amanita thiersii Skay4041]|uniref:Uncharacterized protein n=1 Tax=Amanita thiersii Skay4041 TaxID=703135 RepID=A0A2A9NZL9_9AGAR|nr:hypothetical protein AMATHDRAFT_55347 [Amanita thiersii Skay4041]